MLVLNARLPKVTKRNKIIHEWRMKLIELLKARRLLICSAIIQLWKRKNDFDSKIIQSGWRSLKKFFKKWLKTFLFKIKVTEFQKREKIEFNQFRSNFHCDCHKSTNEENFVIFKLKNLNKTSTRKLTI